MAVAPSQLRLSSQVPLYTSGWREATEIKHLGKDSKHCVTRPLSCQNRSHYHAKYTILENYDQDEAHKMWYVKFSQQCAVTNVARSTTGKMLSLSIFFLTEIWSPK